MATTKAAKSITINATKYELANSLDYQNGKLQLKAKDVVLDETEVGGSKYVKILFTTSGNTNTVTDIEVADGMSLSEITVSDLYEMVMQGVPVLLCYDGIASSDTGKVTAIPCNHIHDDDEGSGGTYANFEFAVINDVDYFHGGGGAEQEIVRYSLIAALAGTLASVIGTTYLYKRETDIPVAPSVKITKCKVLAPSGYTEGFLEAMAVNDSVTCTIPSGFPKKAEVDSGLVYGGIQGADLVINNSNDTNGLYIVPLQLVHASGGTQPRYAYFTLYDGKVFRTVLSSGGGTSQWDITRIA